MKTEKVSKLQIPISEKILLTVNEASALTGICKEKLTYISNYEGCPFVIFNGNKRMFKRKQLIEYLEKETQL